MTQWAKQQACWEGFKKVPVPLDESVKDDLITATEAQVRTSDDRKQRAMDTGFEAVARVLAVKTEVWEGVYKSTSQAPISPTEKDLIQMFGLRRDKVPTERQAAVLLRLLERMAANGVLRHDSF